MKILWLSNIILTTDDITTTGTWLSAMAQRLTVSDQIVLGNIAKSDVRELTPRDCPPVRQWLVPNKQSGKKGLPPSDVIDMVIRTVDFFKPDLVHIWGVEAWWGLLAARGFINQPILLEMQGIMGVYSRVYAGGLTLKEQRSCRGLKEIILRRSIEKDRRRFAAWGNFENEIIKGCQHVSIQTPWVEAWVRAINPGCKIYRNDLMLRQQFYDAATWSPSSKEPILFCSAAYSVPYKGLHDVIRATALLSRRFPKIRLRIAGAHQKPGIRQDGYVRWLNKLSQELGISDRIDWLGALSAEMLAKEIKNCSAFVMPSHTETYCMALAEALYMGCPSVTTFTGGTSWLVKDETAGLFYPPGDEAMCAYQVERLLTNKDLTNQLSCNARAVALKRNDPVRIVSNQIKIYAQVIGDNSSDNKL